MKISILGRNGWLAHHYSQHFSTSISKIDASDEQQLTDFFRTDIRVCVLDANNL